ncbi:MAG: site-2 protease family protein, partial [Kiritimatiellaeota bacterium]|nr:site-2 protease family protein [Kiritimatiellota bacterium]
MDTDVFFKIFRILALVFSVIIHEIAHAYAALKCGDTTARDAGRITLNPIPHIDPVMTIALPLILTITGSPIIFGGAKPVPV